MYQKLFKTVDNKRFLDDLERRIYLMKKTLASKGKEYAANGDRHENFNNAALMLGVNREKALLGMLSKHLVSIIDIIHNFDKRKPSGEMIEEKIGDAINYLVLLESMMKMDITDDEEKY